MPISITQAANNVANSGFLETQGSGKDSFVGLDLTNTAQMLYGIAGQFALDATDNLSKDDKNSSGDLTSSIIPLPLKILGSTVVAQVKAADYYDFVNKGVKGLVNHTTAPQSPYSFKYSGVSKNMMIAIRKWLIREGIRARNLKKGITKRETQGRTITETSNSVAYRIATSIKRKGIKPDYFWDKALVSLKDNINEKIGAAFKVDVTTTVTKV